MPRGDGTGPLGLGSMTGRGLGRCADAASRFAGFVRGLGRGLAQGGQLGQKSSRMFGFGRGGSGRGRGRRGR